MRPRMGNTLLILKFSNFKKIVLKANLWIQEIFSNGKSEKNFSLTTANSLLSEKFVNTFLI